MRGKLSGVFLIIVFGVLALASFFLVKSALAGTLYCKVAASCEQTSATTTIFRMQNASNSHAGVATSTYTQLVCCGGVTDIGYGCSSSTKAVVLYLSDRTNAHSRQNSQAGYATTNATPVCISAPSTPTVGYVAGNSTCAAGGYDTTLGSMSAVTNAHIGNATAYAGAANYKICATAAGTLISITRSAGDAIIAYGTVNLGSSTTTDPAGINDVETFRNTGSVAEQFSIKTSNAVGGTGWTVGSSPGTNIYTHSFATNTNVAWQVLDVAESYEVASSSVAVNGNLNIYMKIQPPLNTGGDYSAKTVTITLFAEQSP